ncbi:hypothetical protein [Clostridium estertheticum]|uniref:hypothetical protein n=1 Tax=Clostridium estertheticum TaxID=238834 RepID=UPI001C6E74B7|nr:hypothetical protein [Clostridium estertheticum]MBW9152299.1 hypothetical protein [Clostridium estertheticum]
MSFCDVTVVFAFKEDEGYRFLSTQYSSYASQLLKSNNTSKILYYSIEFYGVFTSSFKKKSS